MAQGQDYQISIFWREAESANYALHQGHHILIGVQNALGKGLLCVMPETDSAGTGHADGVS
jgi:hypothetical protein|tara:strand:+ start:138 stop:320 length:183 start_codon:yes stop_codon:yes gene_type:complete